MCPNFVIPSERELIPYECSEELPPEPWLVLSPHPDDEILGMGGTLAKGLEKGIRIYIWEVTSGDAGGLPDIRELEVQKALSLLGLPESNIIFTRIPEKNIWDYKKEIFLKLNDLFSQIKPYTFFIPSLFEYHPVHRTVSYFFLEWIKGHKTKISLDHLIAFYEITRPFESNFLICIDQYFSKKIKALENFESQNHKHYQRIAENLNGLRSYTVKNCKLVEGFLLIPALEYFALPSKTLRYFPGDFQNWEQEKYIERLKQQIWNLKEDIKERDKNIQNLKDQLSKLNKHIEQLNNIIFNLKKEKLQLEHELKEIKLSLSWKIITKYREFLEKILPTGTRRRRIYEKMKKYIIAQKSIRRQILKERIKKRFVIKTHNKSSKIISIDFDSDFITLKKLEQLKIKNNISISALSVIYNNSKSEIENLIRSLKGCNFIKDIVIVDNSEDNQDRKYLKDQVNTYIKSKNIGFGKAVNKGINFCKNDLVLVINPDATIDKNSVEYLTKAILYKENIALVEARQVPYEHPKFYNPINLDPIWASGCCFLIRKDKFLEVGGFDPNIFLYGEDVDLSWRLMAQGLKIKYIPLAKVYHNFSPREALHRFNYLSNLYLRLKYGQPLKNWLLLSLGKKISLKEIFSYFIKGLKSRKYFSENNYKSLVFFNSWDFGYEFFRRRGFDVPVHPLKRYPKVSIIIRTHYRKDLLKRALFCVANQTYPNIEVIVVEDKSSLAPEIISLFPELSIIYLKTNKGRTNALNIALKTASGEYIFFLDDDDVIFCDCLEILVSYAEKYSKKFVYGGSIKFETDDKIKGILVYSYFDEFQKDRLMVENYIPMGSFIIKRELIDKIGLFDEELEYLEDWDFIRRAAQFTDFLFVPKDILIYCVPQDRNMAVERQIKLDKAYNKVVSKKI